jgi:hypothetical protein
MEEFYPRDIVAIIKKSDLTIVNAISRIAQAAQLSTPYLDSMRMLREQLETIIGARVQADEELIRKTGRDLSQLTNAENSNLEGIVNRDEQEMLVLVEQGFNKLIDAIRETMGTLYREELFRGFSRKVTANINLTTKARADIREMRASKRPDKQKLQFAEEIIRAYTTVQTNGQEMFQREAEVLTNTADLEDTIIHEAHALTASLDKLLQAVIDEASELKTSLSSMRIQQPLPNQPKRPRRKT